METIWQVLAGLTILVLGLCLLEWFRSGETKMLVSAWGDIQENRILIDLIDDFRKRRPSIKIYFERVPYFEYVQKLLSSVAGGAGPDVIFVEVNNFMDFYFAGILEPLNSYIEASHVDLRAYYPQVLDRFTVEGSTYIIPRDTAPMCVVYYNRNAFD